MISRGLELELLLNIALYADHFALLSYINSLKLYPSQCKALTH